MTNSLFVDKKTKKSIFTTRSHSQLYSFISKNVNNTLGENSFKLGDTTIGDKRLEQWKTTPVYQDLETVNFYPAEFYPEGRFDPVITRDYNIHLKAERILRPLEREKSTFIKKTFNFLT